MASRLDQLLALLKDDPDDAFTRYGVAMELSKAGRGPEAMDQFRELLRGHPDYVAGYFMSGRLSEQSGDIPAAKALYERGVAAARRTGDNHAASEIAGALEALG